MRVHAIAAMLLTCVVAAQAVHVAPPLHNNSKNGTHPPNGSLNNTNGTTYCFLTQFRSLTTYQAKFQRVKLSHAVKVNVGSTVFDGVLMGIGAIFMFCGARVTKGVLFLSGFGVGAVALFLAVSNIFNMVKWSNCWVLGIVPLIGGLILGILVLKVVKLAFFCIGAATGGILGYYVYALVAFRLIHVASCAACKFIVLSHNLTFWGCIMIPGIVFGMLTVKLEDAIIAMATAVTGSLAFVFGFQSLVLVHLFKLHKFQPSLHQADYQDPNYYRSPYVYGPLLAALVLALIGTVVQLKTYSGKKKSDDLKDMPIGGDRPSNWNYSSDRSIFQ